MDTMTLTDLRRELGQEFQKIKEGKSSPTTVKALCAVNNQIIRSVKLELDYAKMMGVLPLVAEIDLKALPSLQAATPKNDGPKVIETHACEACGKK